MELSYPFTGTWLVQNSPADRVPSHGTRIFATSHAIDFTPVGRDGRSAPFTLASVFRPEPPEHFVGFGRAVLAPVSGMVHAAHDGEPDHPAFRGLPSIGYAATQAGRVRDGWRALAGNHVVIDSNGVFVVLCHLRRGSIRVHPGQQVQPGNVIAGCGNSGNSTEPHLHIQVMDAADPGRAAAVPLSFPGGVPRNGTFVSV